MELHYLGVQRFDDIEQVPDDLARRRVADGIQVDVGKLHTHHTSTGAIWMVCCRRTQQLWRGYFPPGWWGWFLETFGAKPLAASIDDSLQRLKRASERQYQQAQTSEEIAER